MMVSELSKQMLCLAFSNTIGEFIPKMHGDVYLVLLRLNKENLQSASWYTNNCCYFHLVLILLVYVNT